jgi:hypothetical protein
MAELADQIGVAEATVFYWERGSKPRKPTHRAAYASLLRSWAEHLADGVVELTSHEGAAS